MNTINFSDKELRQVLTTLNNNYTIDGCKASKLIYNRIQKQINGGK